MSKLDSLETIEALANLVGSVYPSGDTLEDRERVDNLCVLIDIVNWALDTIEDSAESRYDVPYYYGHEIGDRAYSALCEWRDRLVEHVEKNP